MWKTYVGVNVSCENSLFRQNLQNSEETSTRQNQMRDIFVWVGHGPGSTDHKVQVWRVSVGNSSWTRTLTIPGTTSWSMGPWGPGYSAPFFFSKSCSFRANLIERETSYFERILGSGPPLGSKLRWVPLTKFLDLPLLRNIGLLSGSCWGQKPCLSSQSSHPMSWDRYSHLRLIRICLYTADAF